MIVPISSHLIPIIQEALAIAYQVCEDEESREIFKECMWQVETAEMNTDDLGAARFVSGEKGKWQSH